MTDAEWMRQVTDFEAEVQHELARWWEDFAVQMAAALLEFGCSATPTRDPRTPIPIHPGSAANQEAKNRAR